jgi:hypothetical protein
VEAALLALQDDHGAEHYALGMLFAQTVEAVGKLLDESAIYT